MTSQCTLSAATEECATSKTEDFKVMQINKFLRTKLLCLFVCILLPFLLNAQSKKADSLARIEGRITAQNGNPITDVSIIISNLNTGTTSRNDGYFDLENINPGHYQLIFSALGYEKLERSVDVRRSQKLHLDIQLKKSDRTQSPVRFF